MKNNDNYLDYHEIIECITKALDAKDPYTGDHSQRVSDMAKIVCNLLGLKKFDTDEIHIAAHLHDIGKIGIPDSILLKDGPLNSFEWNIMKQHPIIGADILSSSPRLKEIGNIVRFHHERYDGKGYPEGLRGEKIPVGSRIIAICDSVDAMTTRRSYREARSLKFAYAEIEKNLGLMYDPFIGEYFLHNWKDIVKG